jgi:hypothetical protein
VSSRIRLPVSRLMTRMCRSLKRPGFDAAPV